MIEFEAGQCWAYKAPEEIPQSRIVIGAILDFDRGRRIACCAVTGALQRRPDGTVETVTIPFLPMTFEALAASVVQAEAGSASLPEEFAAQLETWQNDPRGVSYFTIPFEGSLERMIALQMAAILEQS